MMSEYSKILGDTVKNARCELGLTQHDVASKIDIDVRTIINIENHRGNPKMEILYPLIRTLKIDAREIFNPELQREDTSLRQLRFMIEECNAQEAAALLPAIEAILSVLRSNKTTQIK